jgi:molybdate transport system substrate-binding protein
MRKLLWAPIALLLSCASTILLSCAPATAQADIRVFAAASLKNALDAIAAEYTRGTGKTVSVSYAASSALARQIEQGAPADLFFSADMDWMDYLDGRGELKAGTRRNLLGNRLVLVAPVWRAAPASIAGLPAALGAQRLAVANVDAVPAGKYAKAALEHLGLWGALRDRLAPAENVRAALTFVARGETPLGIVYETDAKAERRVLVVDVFPENSHSPIVYPVALTRDARSPAADFLRFLTAPGSAAVFTREGFTVLERSGS